MVGRLIRDATGADGSTRRTPALTKQCLPGVAPLACRCLAPARVVGIWTGRTGEVACGGVLASTGRQRGGGILTARTRSNPSGCECLGRDAVQALFADAMYSKFLHSLWTVGPPVAITARVPVPVCHGVVEDLIGISITRRAACCCRILQPSKASNGGMQWLATPAWAPTTGPFAPRGRTVSVTPQPAFPTPTDITRAAP